MAKPETDKFAQLTNLKDVANYLGLVPNKLSYILYRIPLTKRYIEFSMGKKSGGQRLIKAPHPPLKKIQRKLNVVLQKIYWENYDKRRNYIYGFASGQHILDNAKCHVRSKYVVNIDLKNFFDEVTFPRVRGMFMKYPFSLPKGAATVLAHIVTHDFRLPQGAPTSPVISNFILARMDGELWRFARKHHCRYSRFADDITFSTKQAKLPSEVGTLTGDDFALSSRLEKIIAIQNNFPINFNKVRCMCRYNRQEVTGLTVNDKVNVSFRYIKQIRAMLRYWELDGEDSALATHLSKSKKHHNQEAMPTSFSNIVLGKLQFLKQIQGERSRAYRRLLFQYSMLSNAPEAIIASQGTHFLSQGIYIIEAGMNQGTAFKMVGGIIVTNAHVLPEECNYGFLMDVVAYRHHEKARKYHLHLLCIDRITDYAILKIHGGDAPCFAYSEEDVKEQQKIFVAGYPHYSDENVSFVEGKIRNKMSRENVTWYSITATILTGNSGGPVFNENLEVIGVASRGGENQEQASDAINAFIPISYVVDAWKAYLSASSAPSLLVTTNEIPVDSSTPSSKMKIKLKVLWWVLGLIGAITVLTYIFS